MTTIHWLGCGLSSVPGIRRLATSNKLQANNITMRLWNRDTNKAAKALEGLTHSVNINEFSLAKLAEQTHQGDIIVSMLPASMHVEIAQLCLKKNANFISSSYISDAMLDLHTQAKDKNLSFVNETGLDPGLDHLLAHLLIDEYTQSPTFNKNHQHSFRSYCGGFPKVPNDFKYKFSWSPLGVLKALKSPAQWIAGGNICHTSTPWKSLSQYTSWLPTGTETFQAYPNRDSLPFIKQYHIAEDWNISEFVRGTLRLNGWAEAWEDIFTEVEQLSGPESESRLKTISDELWATQTYKEGEADRVVLSVELEVVNEHLNTVWHKAYAIDACGNDQGSAMARLVSNTVSLAVESLIDDKLPKGVNAGAQNPTIIKELLSALNDLGDKIESSNFLD